MSFFNLLFHKKLRVYVTRLSHKTDNQHNYISTRSFWCLYHRGSPFPIPNRAVKPDRADGSWPKARKSKSMPILKPHSLI